MDCLFAWLCCHWGRNIVGFWHSVNGSTWVSIGVAGIVVLLWLGPKLPRMRWAEWVGERSIVFYVVHVPAMLVVLNFIGPGSLSGNALTLLLLIVGAVAGLIFTREIFSWLFVFPQRISK